MPELAFDEIVLPEQEEDSAPESMQFDEIVLPRDSGQFEQIVLPQKLKTETEAALAETPILSDHSQEWNQRQREMVKRAEAAGLPATTDSRQRLIDAIARTETAGFKTPHFIGLPDEPTGDRAPTRDIENLVASLKQQESVLTGPERDVISKQRAFWEKEVTEGMSAELWRKQTGDPEPLYPHEKLTVLMSGKYGKNVRIPKGMKIPTLSEVGVIPKEAVEGVLRYTNPIGLGLTAAEKLSPDAAATKVARGAIEGFSETLASFTTPENLAQLAIMPQSKIAQVMLNLGFGAEAIRHIPEQIEAFGATDDLQEKAKIATGIAASLGLPAFGVFHAVGRKAPVRPASEPEAPLATTERPIEQTPQGQEPARPQPVQQARPEQRMVPIEELPPTESIPVTPTLRPGEKQGDLLSTQPEDLTLVGEKGPDNARRQADAEAKVQADEEARLKQENEQELLADFSENQRRGGDELLTALKAEGGLPSIASGRPEFAGELQNVRDEVRNPNRKERIKYADIFRNSAQDIDNLTTRMRARGFQVETPGQLLDLVRDRVRTGEKLFGVEAMGEMEMMSPGPGAASSKENLASYELRRFGQRFQETERIDPAIREETGNRYYEPIPNKLTLDEAGKIIDARGTDEAVRLVRDETFAMEPRVRATLAQTLVQKLNQSHAEATAAGDAPRAKGFLDQAVDTAEYLGEFGTRLGQGVQSFAIWSRLTPEGMLESAKRSAKRANVELTPEQQAEIRRLSEEAQAAPEGIPKHDATKKLADYVVQHTGIPARDLPLSIYYTHILSGVNTHVVNAVDTALNVMHEVNNLAVTNPRAAASIYSGLMRGLGEGKYDGILSLQEGRRITSSKFIESPDLLEVSTFGKKGGVPIAVTGKVSGAAKRIAESKLAKPLNAYKYVMRMMSASDAVFFRGAEEARAGLLAHRLAEATGTERAKLKSEVDNILGYDRLPEFREQAAKEGYTGAKAEARATELMIQSRPESLRADAADYAGVSTYNHEPRGVLGYLSNKIAQTSNKYPVLKLFVPFTRIVANVTNRGLDNTPMGILRALKEKGLSKEERQRVLTRGIAGTAGIIGLGVLDATGIIKVHGAGPSGTERKRQLRDAGWKPFSVQVGDNYFTYTYTPIGLGLSVLGNYLDSQRYNELSQKDSLTRVAYSMSRIGTTVFSQSFLSGLSNLFNILSGDPGQSVNSLKQFFSNVVTAATTPNLIRDVNHIFDPVARKSESIAQDLIRNIPVARLSLKPTLNAFGEPVELSRNRFYSGRSDDPAWRLVVNKNLRVPVVDQTTFIDSEDGYLYAKIAGGRMRKYIVANLAILNRATDQAAQDMLSEAARAMFDEARQDIVAQGGWKKKRKR